MAVANLLIPDKFLLRVSACVPVCRSTESFEAVPLQIQGHTGLDLTAGTIVSKGGSEDIPHVGSGFQRWYLKAATYNDAPSSTVPRLEYLQFNP